MKWREKIGSFLLSTGILQLFEGPNSRYPKHQQPFAFRKSVEAEPKKSKNGRSMIATDTPEKPEKKNVVLNKEKPQKRQNLVGKCCKESKKGKKEHIKVEKIQKKH